MRRPGSHGVADQFIRSIGYGTALALVQALKREGFVRPYCPAAATLRAAELRRLSPSCDIDATAARLGLKPSDLRRRLRRRHRLVKR